MLTKNTANKVYDILVEHAGAGDYECARMNFVYHQTNEFVGEWRFQGKLGFGGKFYRSRSSYDRQMRVDCYPEDMSDERKAIIAATNSALENIKQ